MDIFFFRDLTIMARIGVRDWERQVKQPVIVNLELAVDVKAASRQDNLAETLSYSEVLQDLQEFVGNSEFQLIETLAEQIADRLLNKFGIPWLKLELVKPQPLKGTHSVGVIIERGKN